MPSDPQNNTEDILAQVGDWVLIGGQPSQADRKVLEYFMVYVADTPLVQGFMQAAQRLVGSEYTETFKGMLIEFKTEPGPGFVLLVQRAWALETPAQRHSVLEQILWEVNHIGRGLV
jgi:hypothetical protein